MSEPNTNTENFDVFLCHNSEDKPEIREIARQLAEYGIKPWLDEDQIRPGTSWQTALGEQIQSKKHGLDDRWHFEVRQAHQNAE